MLKSLRRQPHPANHFCRQSRRLVHPSRDLRRKPAELLGQIVECPGAFDGSHRHLCLESCLVAAFHSNHRLAPSATGFTVASVKPGCHLSYRPNSWRSAPFHPLQDTYLKVFQDRSSMILINRTAIMNVQKIESDLKSARSPRSDLSVDGVECPFAIVRGVRQTSLLMPFVLRTAEA